VLLILAADKNSPQVAVLRVPDSRQ